MGKRNKMLMKKFLSKLVSDEEINSVVKAVEEHMQNNRKTENEDIGLVKKSDK